MQVIRVTADLVVSDIEDAMDFYTGFLGLNVQDMGLDWITRVVVWRIDLRATALDGIQWQSTAPGMSRYMHIPQRTWGL